jgi:hypothetical protein
MTDKDHDHFKLAREIVSKWPKWKREISFADSIIHKYDYKNLDIREDSIIKEEIK